jgi:DNA-binding beta-propeller fold protein YncE
VKETTPAFVGLLLLIVTLALAGPTVVTPAPPAESAPGGPDVAPAYEVDASWPKPLPNDWLMGQVGGIAVDAQDHVWVLQRPGSLTRDELGAAQDPPLSSCCHPAPSVLELDTDGNLLQAWGGPGEGYDWPQTEHGIFIDHEDNVWVAGSGPDDHQVLKFERDGTFLLQIGRAGQTGGSNHEELLGRPADIAVDPGTNEVFIADGYGNRRIIVFDGETGAYRRHWGAYGNRPDDTELGRYDPDAPVAPQFRRPVHAVRIAEDGLVYVADRLNDRIQVFHKDGTFVKEVVIADRTRFNGSVWDLDFSRETGQPILFTVDGTNQHVWMLNRAELRILGKFGRSGRSAGQFHWVHVLAVDSNGNIYTGEVDTGRRAQKFVPRPGASTR